MKRNWAVAGVLSFLAAIVYFASMASYTFPGEGADLIAAWRGLEVMAGPE